ncbi:TPA: hypothetical protein U2I45_001209 [Providencia rettgeri]|nr:hypothetical protein [Providencia rettgeri]
MISLFISTDTEINWLDIFTSIGAVVAALGALAAAFYGRKSANAAIDGIVIARTQLNEYKKISFQQSFEQTFYMLLELHNNELDKINKYILPFMDDGNNPKNGLEKLIYEYSLGSKIVKQKDFLTKNYRENVLFFCNLVRCDKKLSNYFRVLYQILKLVDTSPYFKYELNEEKNKYTNIIRSFISDEVLVLIAINALMIRDIKNKRDHHYDVFRLMLTNFDFLQHMKLFSKENCFNVDCFDVYNMNIILNGGIDIGDGDNEGQNKIYEYIDINSFIFFIYKDGGKSKERMDVMNRIEKEPNSERIISLINGNEL